MRALLLALLGTGLAWGQGVPPLTLQQCVGQALDQNPSIHRRTEEALAEEAAVDRLAAEEIPRLFAESTYKDGFPGTPNFSFRGFVQSSSILNYGADVVFSWTYDFGRSQARTRAQKHVASSARAEERAQMGLIAMRTAKAYHDLLLAQAIAELEGHNVEARETIARFADLRFRKGTIPRLDVGLARAGLEEARVRKIRADNEVLQARAVMANLMGLENIAGLEFAEARDLPPEMLAGTVEEDLPGALRKRPEMDSARARVNWGEQTLEAADAGHRPTLRFLATTGYLQTRTVVNPSDYSFGVAVTFPIFSGGAVDAEIEEAEHRLAAAKDRVEDQAQAVRLEITRARLLLSSLLETRQAINERLRQAADSEHLATSRYKHGLGNILELQQAQLALLGAQTEEARNRYDTMSAYYNLHYTRGEILEDFLGGSTP